MFPFFLNYFLALIPSNKGNFSFFIDGLTIKDLTETSDHSIRKFKRPLENIHFSVLHQTSFNWLDSNSNWNNVDSHFVVLQSGIVLALHDPIWRLRTGSNLGNEHGITIEFEGNYPSINGKCYRPEKFGCDATGITREQILAGKRLLWNLKLSYVSLKSCLAHIQWDSGKTNCCGPHVWQNLGLWSKSIGYEITQKAQKGGRDIPNEWLNDKYLVV